MNYKKFLEQKLTPDQETGFEAKNINNMLFDFQHDITKWAVKRGRAAIFADCGLGKTPMQLEWANQVYKKTKKNILILAPLAVAKQTKREGQKFNIRVHICRTQSDVNPGNKYYKLRNAS